MWCVVGLGNPGTRYERTRHNVGFMVVDALASRCGARLRPGPVPYLAATVRCAGSDVVLVKPTTYVNRSGYAVRQALARSGLGLDALLVVVDDVYLPFGRLRLRGAGSAGGHNGLHSIETVLGSTAYPRLRLGVGAAAGVDLADWVLGPFTPAETEALPAFVERAASAVESIVELGVERAQPLVNAPAPG